ncbi:hypothetical protein EGW08_011866 [Elysia chlorotica]|uniref:Uncharacterized protein n=1 Tax=Elysia chlorotica TaxID=188477 RepID=A0A433TFT1_ELYCH|nr:hypothetical protein EGW08_011866 [Elysia chlorotica]
MFWIALTLLIMFIFHNFSHHFEPEKKSNFNQDETKLLYLLYFYADIHLFMMAHKIILCTIMLLKNELCVCPFVFIFSMHKFCLCSLKFHLNFCYKHKVCILF